MTLHKFLNYLLLTSLLLTTAAFYKKGRLPSPGDIRSEILQDPQQINDPQAMFSFDYRDKTYDIEPVASYELNGLVVSHNNITGLADITHDKNSIDSKDVCVIWGENLKNGDFRRVKYWSGDWTCYYQYPSGVMFRGDELSNNHMITSSDDVREKINDVRIGDQIHISGFLVNYRDRKNPDWWRRTSLTRTDTGNGACEVVFVKSLDFLRRGTPAWYDMFDLGRWAIPLCLVVKIGLMLFG